MGFQSDSHAALGTAKYWKNIDVLPSDFRNVTSVYGPDVCTVQSKGTIIDSLRQSNPRKPNTELTVLEGPVPLTLTRIPNPEKVFLITFLLY